MNDKHPKTLILEALINHPEGLTMVSLVEVVGLHRHTATKYLYELIGAGLVYQRKVGPARLCYLREKVEENEKETHPSGVQDKKWFGGKSQIRFIAIFLLLGIILVSSSVIASNFLNETFANTSPTGELISHSTKDTTLETPPQETTNVEIIPNDSTEKNSIEVNSIYNETSETIDTSPSQTINENYTSEITEPSNTSEVPLNDNETTETSETNDTDVSKTINETLPIENPPIEAEEPILNVKVECPKRITRGDAVVIKAKIENTGSSVVKNIVHNWVLPKGFEIISEEDDCENLEQNASCASEITVQTSFSADVGIGEIRIVVRYGT